MGLFIIGVLVGWLAEWVFFTFFIKGKMDSSGGANTSALQSELDARNRQIKELQAKIADSGAASSSTVSSASTAEKTVAATGADTASKAKTKTSTQSASRATTGTSKAKPSTAKPTEKKAAVSKKASTPAKKSSTKPGAKKATPAQSKTAASKPAKKAATKATTKATTKSKKTTATKAKTSTKKAASKATKATAAKKITVDDFTKLSGIGPSMAATLNELGIDTYKKLADMDDDILRDMLEASGARLNNNKEAMDSWNEQALLADKGDFDGLKKLQEALKK